MFANLLNLSVNETFFSLDHNKTRDNYLDCSKASAVGHSYAHFTQNPQVLAVRGVIREK